MDLEDASASNTTNNSVILISRVFSELQVAEIVRVAQRQGQFQQPLETQVILTLNFTRTHSNYVLKTEG